MIPLSKPYLTGNEIKYIEKVFENKHLSGNGAFSLKSGEKLKKIINSNKVFLTTSCTDALEMAAILIQIEPEDEVIVPSYTFSSTANAFALRGAKIIFADSLPNHPNLDVSKLTLLITKKTKAIIPVHYAGEPVDMDPLMALARKHNFYVIEDAAHAIGGSYKGKALGTIGHFGAFSFHDTKPIVAGEGGALSINDTSFIEKAEYVHEKGTDRTKFTRKETEKYDWVTKGSSFLPSETIAATLLAQLEAIEEIHLKRKAHFLHYLYELKDLPKAFILPSMEGNQSHFYIICPSEKIRDGLIRNLKNKEVMASFHYRCLHLSPFAQEHFNSTAHLPHAEKIEQRLLRLPFYINLTEEDITFICSIVRLYSIIDAQKML